MVKPATARRRNKIQQQQQQAAHAAHVAQQKEDETSGLHDEADVMSFRSAATHRFLLNQELIENITEKWIHTDSIIKPKPFPNVQTTKKNIDEIKDEIYFGNLSLMEQKLAKLQEEMEQIKSAPEAKEDLKNIISLHSSIDKMTEAFAKQTPVDYSALETNYTEITAKKVNPKKFVIRSLPNLKVDKSEAPENYWEELNKAREAAKAAALLTAQQSIVPPNNDLVMTDTYNMVQTGPTAPDQINYGQTAFGNDDINMMDDVGFGLQSTLDDQDFLSQIDHSME